MNKRILLLFFGLTLLFNQGNAQTYKEQFNALISKKDTLGERLLLEKWEMADKDDPELFVAYFNYYVHKSKEEVITLGQDPKGDALQIMDQDKSKKEPVGYIYGSTYFDPELLNKGLDWIKRGIEKYPDRLDMRFGQVYMMGEIEDYETFTTEIIKTIDYSSVNKNKWTWADNKPLQNPKEFMLNAIQDYQVQLNETEVDSLLNNMKRIAQSVLKYYPDHVESLSNLSVVYLLQGEYDKALDPLLKAEKLNPKDYIVLGNIAQAYKLKGDKQNAIKYYELALKYGDDETKKYAQSQIKELKKKK